MLAQNIYIEQHDKGWLWPFGTLDQLMQTDKLKEVISSDH